MVFLFFLVSCRNNNSHSNGSLSTNDDPEVILEDHASNMVLASHLYLKINIQDSTEGYFLFDSGANGLILDKTFVKENRLSLASSKHSYKTYGVGEGSLDATYAYNVSSSFNDHYFEFDSCRIMGLDSLLGSVLDNKIDGIIGADVFSDYIMKMDFDNQYVRLTNGIDKKDLEDYVAIPYSYEYRKPMVPINISLNEVKQFPAKLMFDMGSGSGVSLTHKKSIKENLFSHDHSLFCEVDSVSGIGGISSICLLEINAIETDTLVLQEKGEIEISKDKRGALGMHTMYDGILGMDIIKNYNVVIDQEKQIIYLKRRKISQ